MIIWIRQGGFNDERRKMFVCFSSGSRTAPAEGTGKQAAEFAKRPAGAPGGHSPPGEGGDGEPSGARREPDKAAGKRDQGDERAD